MTAAKPKSERARKAPKKITESYLHNSGLHYLQRFSTGTENFRRVMMRKVDRSCRHHKDQSREDCAVMVEALIEKFARAGLLNDADYTRAAVATLRRRGESARAIEARLRAKGLPREEIRKNLETDDDADAEFMAALRFARRRRLGPFATGKPKEHEKQMAAFARAGHEYEVAAKILKLNSEEAAGLL
jgi:regulatory protein